MKKLVTKEEREKKTQRNQLIMGSILIMLMILSTVGYALVNNETGSTSDSVLKYKGITFTRQGDYWYFNAKSYDFVMKYNPNETKEVKVNVFNTIESYKDKPLYFVTVSGQPEMEISRNLIDRIPSRIQNACLFGNNCSNSPKLPVYNCDSQNLIVIREPLSNESENIYQDNKCVYIITSDANESLYSDAFLFSVLNI